MATRTEIEKRTTLFWQLLSGNDGELLGSEVPYSTFSKATKALGKELSDRSCKNFLQGMKKNPSISGTVLTIGGKGATLQLTEESVSAGREKQRPGVKAGLGRTLWEVLFRLDLSKMRQTFKMESYEIALTLTETTQRKLLSLREKSPISLFVDAGSTTIKAVEQLIAHESVPVRIPCPDGRSRFASLNITTNCPKIATKLNDSKKHSSNIGVTVVGGELRAERGSICGAVAQQWLRMWRGTDSAAGDVAVVGSTGIRSSMSGEVGFGSDNLEEAQLKSAFLSMVWLRVVTFDSSKHSVPPVSKGFASLSAAGIDLVVTDDGSPQWKKEAETFLDRAAKNGVATCVWRSLMKKPHKE